MIAFGMFIRRINSDQEYDLILSRYCSGARYYFIPFSCEVVLRSITNHIKSITSTLHMSTRDETGIDNARDDTMRPWQPSLSAGAYAVSQALAFMSAS